MQEAFAKLKGVDIFSLKSYMEPTNFGSFNGAWVLINELFVNLFFFILNAVVGFFSLLIRILEKIDSPPIKPMSFMGLIIWLYGLILATLPTNHL